VLPGNASTLIFKCSRRTPTSSAPCSQEQFKLPNMTQIRLLLFVESDNSIPVLFLAVLVIWLAIIFTSFSLFASLNPTVLAVLSLSALSAAGAIFLVLELGQPFVGLMAISNGPLSNALVPLGA
jgi:hypothetical protein